MQNIKNVISTIEKEGYYVMFRTQIAEDTILIEKYRALHNDAIERARNAQLKYANFEKSYFEDLHLSSIERKQNLRKQGTIANQGGVPARFWWILYLSKQIHLSVLHSFNF